MATIVCFDDPKLILEKRFCLSNLSKDVKGEVALEVSKVQKCAKPKCVTLRTSNVFKLSLTNNTCDSTLAKDFNGSLTVTNLVTAYQADGMHRGFHAGDFVWAGANGLKVEGRMSGMTNEGTHRPPIKDCQKCEEVGIMEGRLCGSVTASNNPDLKGCQVIAAYRFRFDATAKGIQGKLLGTVEGAIISACVE